MLGTPSTSTVRTLSAPDLGAILRATLVTPGSAAASVALRSHGKASMVVRTGARRNGQALEVATGTVRPRRKAIGEVFTRVGAEA
jgi:hypothetical protein